MSEQGEPGEQPPAPAKDAPRRGRRRSPTRSDGVGAGLAGAASTIAGAAGPVISAALREVDHLTSGARRMLGERSGAQVRRVRRMGRAPLANLWEVHPEARRAALRELGLQTVLVEQVAGTAVEGAAQRGGDFLPLRDRRSDDWRARWQRLLGAVEGLANLPPVELLKFGDSYWVIDGHNRLAAALYTGQVAIDAVVYELRLPGLPSQRSASIAPYLEGSRDLREAGSGRLTRTTSRPTELSRPRLTGTAAPRGLDPDEPADPARPEPPHEPADPAQPAAPAVPDEPAEAEQAPE